MEKNPSVVFKVVAPDSGSCLVSRKSMFRLMYYKGYTVEALSFTRGIFCFQNWHQANYFRNECCKSGKILRVVPIGKPKKAKYYTHYSKLDSFYHTIVSKKRLDSATDMKCLPNGTVCYPAVKVLD